MVEVSTLTRISSFDSLDHAFKLRMELCFDEATCSELGSVSFETSNDLALQQMSDSFGHAAVELDLSHCSQLGHVFDHWQNVILLYRLGRHLVHVLVLHLE